MKISLIGWGKDASEKDYYAMIPTKVLSVYCHYAAKTKSCFANHQLQSNLTHSTHHKNSLYADNILRYLQNDILYNWRFAFS